MEAHLNICTQNGVFFWKVGLKWFVQCAALVSYILCWFILIYSLPIRVNVQSYYNRIGVCALCIDMGWWFIRKIFCVSSCEPWFWTSKRGSWKLCEVQTVQTRFANEDHQTCFSFRCADSLGFQMISTRKSMGNMEICSEFISFQRPSFYNKAHKSLRLFASFACSVFGSCLVHPWPGKPGKNHEKPSPNKSSFGFPGSTPW